MSDRAVIVIQVEIHDANSLDNLVRLAHRGFREHYDEFGEQLNGPTHLAVGPDMEMVLDVFREPESGGGRHVLRVDNERWHLEHSLVCRRAGLENCRITTLVSAGMNDPDYPPLWEVGEYELRLDEAGVLLWGDSP